MRARRYLEKNQLARWRERTARYTARLRERAKALFFDVCQGPGCDETRGLELAHLLKTGLKGRGRGSARRFRDVLKHPERYTLLCRRCHMDLDYAGRDPWERRQPDRNQELEAVPF